MDPNITLSDVLQNNWEMDDDDVIEIPHEITPQQKLGIITLDDDLSDSDDPIFEDVSESKRQKNDEDSETGSSHRQLQTDSIKKTGIDATNSILQNALTHPTELLASAAYYESPNQQMSALQQVLCYPGYTHGSPISSTYHQPFVSMVRQKKTSALASALQSSNTSIAPVPIAYFPGYPYGHISPYFSHEEVVTANSNYSNVVKSEQKLQTTMNSSNDEDQKQFGLLKTDSKFQQSENLKDPSSTAFDSSQCGQRSSSYTLEREKRDFGFSVDSLNGLEQDNQNDSDELENEERCPNGETAIISGDADTFEGCVKNHEIKEKLVTTGDTTQVGEEDKDEDVEVDVVGDGEDDVTIVNDKGDNEPETLSGDSKQFQSQLKTLLMQPVKKPVYQEYQQPFVVAFSAIGNQPPSSGQQPQSAKTMQFYQPPAQHLARNTPPPGFPQPYGMGMRPHEEETRQIMNLDSQQTHNSSPTSSWNQPYGQMTNLNAYQQRPNIYAPPVPPSMVHQNGPPGVVPTSNPYYPTPGPPPPHHHIQPQAPMMTPGMHGQQQQQPYYNTQSPLTGTPPTMNYGNPQIPAPPPASNGSAPIFNFSKPRGSNEGSSVNGGGHRRKKHNDLSSPRYNNNSNEDIDASVFPDMTDFPLLDVVQSKAKKDAGRKPCRPHLCEQSRMLISRVCHFHREFIKRLPVRHPLANSAFSKPDQWTSQIMGISLATVRKCIDMAVDEEVFTRCTDKNLVNLTPAERAEREETLSRLSAVFEGEKSLGSGTSGMTIAEYSPRRSYSNTLLRQSTDDKSSNSSFANGADFGSSETTLLNLDDHSNQSKDFGTTPTPSMELSNGGNVYEEIGSVGGGNVEGEEKAIPTIETPKRGRPRKNAGSTTTKSSKRKESNEDSEVSEDKDDHEKKTEDEDETNEETEKNEEDLQQDTIVEREDDAASSEGTNRSETATPELPADTSVAKKTRSAARRKNTRTVEEDFQTSTKRKRGSVTAATSGVNQLDDENSDHKMVTRARSRQP